MKINGIKYGKPFIEISPEVNAWIESKNGFMLFLFLLTGVLSFFPFMLIFGIIGNDNLFETGMFFVLKFITRPCLVLLLGYLFLIPNGSAEVSPAYLDWKKEQGQKK